MGDIGLIKESDMTECAFPGENCMSCIDVQFCLKDGITKCEEQVGRCTECLTPTTLQELEKYNTWCYSCYSNDIE